MNKKASWIFDSQIFYVFIIITLGFAFAGLMLAMQSYRTEEFEFPEGVEEDLVSRRFLRCFGDAGVINQDKFTDANLNRCYPVDKKQKYFAYQLSLDGVTNQPLKTQNWDDDRAPSARKKIFVQVKKDGQMIGGTLSVEVQS